MEQLGTDYGLWGLLAYVLIKELWPFIRDTLWPSRMKFVQSQEERMTKAIEIIGDSSKLQAEALVALGERMTNMTNLMQNHDAVTTDAITAMLVKTGTMPHRRTTDKKARKKV